MKHFGALQDARPETNCVDHRRKHDLVWRRCRCISRLASNYRHPGRQSYALLMVGPHDTYRYTRSVCVADATRCEQDAALYTPNLVSDSG